MAETRVQQADEAAERVLLLGGKAVFTGVSLLSKTISLGLGAKNLGVRLVDQLDPTSDGKQLERREYLAHYSALQAVNHVVIIGSFNPDAKPEDELVLAGRTASALHDNGVIGHDRATAIQAVMPAEATRTERLKRHEKVQRLDRSISVIQDAVELHYGPRYTPRNVAAADSMYMHEGASRGRLSAFFEPLRHRTGEFEAFVDDHRDALGIDGKQRPPISMTMVADPEDIIPLFKGFEMIDVANGGVIRMMSPEVWQPLRPHVSVSKPERTGRFRRDGERPPATPVESTHQKTPA